MSDLTSAVTSSAKAYAGVCAVTSLLKREPVTRDHTAASLAAFVGLYRALRIRKSLPEGVAGAAAGAVALLVNSPRSRTGMVAHGAVHAVRALWRAWAKDGALPDVPFLDVMVLAAGASRMCSAWLFDASSFDRGHLRSLDYFSAQSPDVLKRLREGLPTGDLDEVCSTVHPGKSCLEHMVCRNMPLLLYRALRVYLPVHILTFVLLRPRQWLDSSRLPTNLRALVERIVRSCMFLALFYQLPMSAACLASRTRHLQAGIAVGGMLGACAVLLEPASRRSSIVPVAFAYSLVSGVRGVGLTGEAVPTPVRAAVFAAACAVLVNHRALPIRAHEFLEPTRGQ